MSLKKYQRIQLKDVDADAARFLCGPYVRLGDVDKKSTTITVLRTGSFSHPKYGRFEITRDLLEGMVRNFDQRTYGQDIQMDVAHKPEDGNAGDIKRLFIEGNRLRAQVEWTDYGLNAIRERGFKYISADFANNWIDHEFEKEHGPVLFGAALCTRPFVKNMEPVQLSEEGGKTIVTFIHPETIKHFKSEEQNMKKLLDALKAKLAALKLSEAHITQFIQLFETTGEQIKDNEDALKQLSAGIESQARQLSDALADGSRSATAPIQLGEITIHTGGDQDIAAIVAKQLADIQAQQLSDANAAKQALETLQKQFDDALAAAEGLTESTIKRLNDARDLITPAMTADQVKRLAEQQISLGNEIEASRQLSQMGYQMPGAAGSVQIHLGDDNSSLQLQETINKNLGNTSVAVRLALTDDKKLTTFARKVLQIFDHLNAVRLHEESKMLAGGETNIGDTNFPVGVQRTVIREALSDLRILELVQGLTDPTAQATTQIPYEVRDTSEVLNDGVVFEGQGIPGASITQAMDLAYILPRKLAMKLSNEVIHFSRASGINWDAYARNVESNARVMRELIARFIANEYQRAADAFEAIAVSAESVAAQLDGSTHTLKTVNYPIVRPHQNYDLRGNAVGSAENAIALTINSTPVTPYDGSNEQPAGTYYRVINYNLGYVQLVSELGTPVTPANTGANTIGYSYATNIVKFDLDVPGTTTLERHLNGLLQKIGSRKAMLAGDRFITPDFMLMSPTLNDTCTNAEQFTAAGKRADANVSAEGDLTTVKSTPAYGTNAPGIDLGDERILIGQRGTCTYTVAKPFMTGTPFEAVDSSGRPTGQKVAYGEEYSAVKVPTPIRGRLTSVIAYSFTGR